MKIVLWILLAFVGCATLKNLVQSPQLNFQNVEFTEPGLDGVTLNANFTVDNPNPIGTRLDGLSYKLQLNDSEAIAGDFKQGIAVPASGRGSFRVPLRLEYRNVFSSLQQLVMQKALRYRIEGQAKIGPFSIPYSHEGEFSPPKLPSLSLSQVSVSELSLNGAKLVAHVKVRNPNGFAIPLDKLRYGLKLGTAQLIEGNADALTVSPSGESELALPLQISGAAIAQSLLAALNGQKTNYDLNLSAQIKGQNLNLASSGAAPVTK